MAGRPYRGIFTIPVTPFHEDGSLDEPGLQSVVEFCVAAGGHGLVAPVNASEFSALSDDERKRVVEVVARTNNGRLPFVAGVSGVSAEVAVLFARHARDAGADALMAMPPYVRKPGPAGIRDYYERLAQATDLPIFIQNYPLPVGVPMSAELMAGMVREIGTIRYIKEEIPPVTHAVSADLKACGAAVEGVFGGAAGKFMLDEMRRGAAGAMPGCDVTDVHAAVWNAWEEGDEARARAVFNRLLPLLNFESLYGARVYKEVLRRRGVIACPFVRAYGSPDLDESDRRELSIILDDMKDLFVVASLE
jgi:4-hydroxy-tetrahydrodipicolinate synthase